MPRIGCIIEFTSIKRGTTLDGWEEVTDLGMAKQKFEVLRRWRLEIDEGRVPKPKNYIEPYISNDYIIVQREVR